VNPSQPKVAVVFNPTAGQADAVRAGIDRAVALWESRGWQVTIEPTRCAGDGTRIAKEAAAAGFNIVVAAGGDGTANEVINGLAGTETALAVLPAGTVNIWAREMGLPTDILPAAEALLLAKWQKIDVGRAKSLPSRRRGKNKVLPKIDRYFLLMAGVGFDAAVAEQVNPSEKKYLGAIAYVKQAVQMAWQYRGSYLKIAIDDKKIRGSFLIAIIGNSQLYGGVIKFTLDALLDDGLLDLCLVRGHTMFKAPLRLLSIFFKSHHRDSRIEYYRARQIQFITRRAIPVQIDGDYLGTTPIQFEVVPDYLWVLIPPNADRSLFSR
jgi:YegS/Rv2252/BmrU family lipid kinase